MKKNSIVQQSPKRAAVATPKPITIGIDVGDKTSRYFVLGAKGEISSEGSVATTRVGLLMEAATVRERFFERIAKVGQVNQRLLRPVNIE